MCLRYLKTGKDEGVYLLSFATKIKCGDKKTNGKTTVQIKDQYGTVIKEATGGDGVSYREDGGTRIIDIVMPVSGLEKEIALRGWNCSFCQRF